LYGAVSYPIFQTATFSHPGFGETSGYNYTRQTNPTRDHLEKIIASLENGKHALAFSSGMAAITGVMELFKPGDHLIVEEDLYGGSIRLFQQINEKNGMEFTRLDISTDDVEAAVKENTKAIFLETPTNPMMKVVDLEKISNIAKKHNLLLIVDNTFLSPYLQNPLDLGADIVVHSGTKYIGGHNDSLAGFTVTANDEIGERLRSIQTTTGASLAPLDSWLILRGVKTLGIRMDRAEENAKQVVDWLVKQPQVTKVYYPGLENHPGHDIMKKQARGFGAMISFNVETKEQARKILENVKVIAFAESLGGTESLITYPITQTHADVPEELRQKNGVTDTLLRLSVGIENIADLLEDLEQAF
jgi:cystathionine gamma-synthase